MGRESLHSAVSEYIAGELRAQRARLDLTFDQVADMSGVKRGSVVRAMSGKSAITIDVMIPLCRALRLDVGKLLDEAAAVASALGDDD